MDSALVQKEYKFKEMRLTPGIIEILISELFSGRVERKDIVDKVLQSHLAGGGKKPKAQDITASVKKALQNMAKKGLATRLGAGYWKIAGSDLPADTTAGDGGENTASNNAHSDQTESELLEASADTVVGIGSKAVYVYYFPMYRKFAESLGEQYWRCKIGQTDGDPLCRIKSQAATALPERPCVALMLKTDLPRTLETALHCVISLRGRRIEDVPGNEWFLTSPKEVLDLVKVFDPECWAPRIKRKTRASSDKAVVSRKKAKRLRNVRKAQK